MPDQSDRDILIEVRTDVKALVRDMTEPGGRVPKLEGKVDEHTQTISGFSGSVRMLMWIVGGVGLLFVTLAGVVFAHILGGK